MGLRRHQRADPGRTRYQRHERKTATHFDRNGFGYTWDRATGELLVAQKFDPQVNWSSGIDMDKSSPTYGRPKLVKKYEPFETGMDDETKGICPSALGAKNEQPASYSKLTGLFYVPTNHVCMDYEPFKVSYTVGEPYVGATLSMYPAPDSPNDMGNFIAWDGARANRLVEARALFRLVGRTDDGWRRRFLRHARRLFQSRRSEGPARNCSSSRRRQESSATR